MIISFETKWGNRYVEGPCEEIIMAYMLKERLNDGFWYFDKEIEEAQNALDKNQATSFMRSRRNYEYEGFERVQTERIG